MESDGKLGALAALEVRTARVNPVFRSLVLIAFWIWPLTQALAPKMLEMLD
jgi:hypothetical protein